CEHETMLLFCELWAPPEWERIAAEMGFVFSNNGVGMTAERLLPPRRPAPPELDLRLLADDGTARDLGVINARAYRMPDETFACVGSLRAWHPESFAYVGYVDGRPVSSASAFPAAGT